MLEQVLERAIKLPLYLRLNAAFDEAPYFSLGDQPINLAHSQSDLFEIPPASDFSKIVDPTIPPLSTLDLPLLLNYPQQAQKSAKMGFADLLTDAGLTSKFSACQVE